MILDFTHITEQTMVYRQLVYTKINWSAIEGLLLNCSIWLCIVVVNPKNHNFKYGQTHQENLQNVNLHIIDII